MAHSLCTQQLHPISVANSIALHRAGWDLGTRETPAGDICSVLVWAVAPNILTQFSLWLLKEREMKWRMKEWRLQDCRSAPTLTTTNPRGLPVLFKKVLEAYIPTALIWQDRWRKEDTIWLLINQLLAVASKAKEQRAVFILITFHCLQLGMHVPWIQMRGHILKIMGIWNDFSIWLI